MPPRTLVSRSASGSVTMPGSTREGSGSSSRRPVSSSAGTRSPVMMRRRTSTEVTSRRRFSIAETSDCASPTRAPSLLWLLRVSARHRLSTADQSLAATAARRSGCIHTSNSSATPEI